MSEQFPAPAGPPNAGVPNAGPPNTQELPPTAPAVKKTERPHPLTPLIRGWIVLVALVLGVGREFIPMGKTTAAASRP